jgi:hypothetical protein
LTTQLLLKAEVTGARALLAIVESFAAATKVTGWDEITDWPDLEADSPTKVSCNMT